MTDKQVDRFVRDCETFEVVSITLGGVGYSVVDFQRVPGQNPECGLYGLKGPDRKIRYGRFMRYFDGQDVVFCLRGELRECLEMIEADDLVEQERSRRKLERMLDQIKELSGDSDGGDR